VLLLFNIEHHIFVHDALVFQVTVHQTLGVIRFVRFT